MKCVFFYEVELDLTFPHTRSRPCLAASGEIARGGASLLKHHMLLPVRLLSCCALVYLFSWHLGWSAGWGGAAGRMWT